MFIPIPSGIEYTCTARGAVLKLVRCEQCETEYVYQMERTARASGTSVLFLDNHGASSRASAEAQDRLRRKLLLGVDLVPCPCCGWYQKDMVPRARKEHRRWMFNAGLCLTVGLLPVALLGAILNSMEPGEQPVSWPVFIAGFATLAIIGVWLIVAKLVSASRYDPNTQDVEKRKQLGNSRAVLRDVLEKRIKAEQEAQDNA